MWRFESDRLVGRDTVLAELFSGLAAARSGRGTVVFLVGEAGIGKSRLVRELSTRAAADGMAVLVGRAVEGEVPAPFRPLAEVLLAAARGGVAVGPSLDPTALAVGDAVLRVVGRRGPALLVLEDLHWADPDTLAAVELIADQITPEPVLCVATVRVPGGGGASALARRLARRSAARLVELATLTGPEVTELAAACLGDAPVPAPVLARLHASADGLPLVVEELLATFGRGGFLVRVDRGWRAADELPQVVPATLAETVADRLAGHASIRRVLGVAALLGHRFDWTLLSAATGLAADEIADVLRHAVDVALVEASGEGFAFRHTLTRQAVLAHLLPPERVRWAAAALRAVDESTAPHPAALVADLARLAADHGRAAAACVQAGREARDAGALDSAAAILSQALELAGPDQQRVAEAGELLVEVLALAGRTDRVDGVGRRTLAALRAVGAPADRVGAVLLATARAAHPDTRTRELIDTAERLAAESGSVTLSARAHALAAHVDLEQGRPADARRRAERALHEAERAGLPEVVCEAAEMLGRHARPHDPDAAARWFGRAAATADEHGLALWRVRARTELGIVGFLRGEPPDVLVEARHLADRLGALSTIATVDLHLAAAYVQRFEADDALAAARRCRAAADRYRWPDLLPRALTLEATALAQLGRDTEMAARLAETARLAPDDRELAAVGLGMAHAGGHLMADQLGAMRSDLDRAVAILRAVGKPGGYRLWGIWALLVTLDGPGAAQACQEARASGATMFHLAEAHLRYADAVRAGRVGEPGRAEEHFTAADALNVHLDFGRHHAHRLVAPAAFRDGWGRPAAWLLAALAYFTDHGHAALARACRAQLRAGGVAVPRAGRGRSTVSGRLRELGVTSREADVLGLVADGRSNTEIAAQLFLSVRTVEGHVGALKLKLGAASRAELVAFAGRHVSQGR